MLLVPDRNLHLVLVGIFMRTGFAGFMDRHQHCPNIVILTTYLVSCFLPLSATSFSFPSLPLSSFAPPVARRGRPLEATTMIPVNDLLSTCVDACLLGCAEIRAIQQKRADTTGSPLAQQIRVTLKDSLDPKSALTEADGAAQRAILQALVRE
jgi:hypothetical protein